MPQLRKIFYLKPVLPKNCLINSVNTSCRLLGGLSLDPERFSNGVLLDIHGEEMETGNPFFSCLVVGYLMVNADNSRLNEVNPRGDYLKPTKYKPGSVKDISDQEQIHLIARDVLKYLKRKFGNNIMFVEGGHNDTPYSDFYPEDDILNQMQAPINSVFYNILALGNIDSALKFEKWFKRVYKGCNASMYKHNQTIAISGYHKEIQIVAYYDLNIVDEEGNTHKFRILPYGNKFDSSQLDLYSSELPEMDGVSIYPNTKEGVVDFRGFLNEVYLSHYRRFKQRGLISTNKSIKGYKIFNN